MSSNRTKANQATDMGAKAPSGAVPPAPSPTYGASTSGALRESIGTKLKTHLVPYELTLAAAMGLNYGADKYDERNFEKGLTASSMTGAIERHNKAIMDGEHIDADSGLPHFALLASSVAMLVHNVMNSRIEWDLGPSKHSVAYDRGERPINIAEHAQVAQSRYDERNERCGSIG